MPELLTVLALVLSGSAAVVAAGAAALTLRYRGTLRELLHRVHRLDARADSFERRLLPLSRNAAEAVAARLPAGSCGPAVCHAQHGEEFQIWQLFDWKPSGFFVEIGAYDGVGFSNSLFFERLGWKGILVEAHPGLAERCRANRPHVEVIPVALGEVDGGTIEFAQVDGAAGMDTLSFAVGSGGDLRRVESGGGTVTRTAVPRRTLDALLSERGISEVDWISVDVEGAELEVLRGSGLEHRRPRLIIVEDNSNGRDRRVAEFLGRQGYRRELTCGCNDFFVRGEL